MTKIVEMQKINDQIKACKKCRLCKEALNAVCGEGNIDTEIIFVGEAPGQTEDETGRPFVGRAGKLLEAGLKLIGLSRENIWIGNIIKHRPPQNRDPLPDEIEACSPFLKEQIRVISPRVVITLGRFAMNYFYPEGKITRDHGKVVFSGGYNIYPMFHPAAALRNPAVKREFALDFKNLPDVIKSIKNSGRMF